MANQADEEQTPRVSVPCGAVIPFFEELRERKLPWDLLTRELEEPVSRLLDPNRTLCWESYRKILTEAGRIWCDEELVGFGRAMARRRC